MRPPQAPQNGNANEKGGSSTLPPLKTISKNLYVIPGRSEASNYDVQLRI